MTEPTQHLPVSLRCPKCGGAMHTYERNGVHIEQCGTCRGIFLDFGELEALAQLEGRMVQQAPPYQAAPAYQQAPPGYQAPPPGYQAPPPGYQQAPPGYGPAWGHQGGHRRGGFSRLFFSS